MFGKLAIWCTLRLRNGTEEMSDIKGRIETEVKTLNLKLYQEIIKNKNLSL